MVGRVQDEVKKISSLGRTQMSRSFLMGERGRLFRRLGEICYPYLKKEGFDIPEVNRLVNQIERMSRKISEIEKQIGEITTHLSEKHDTGQGTDLSTIRQIPSKKIFRRKKPMQQKGT